MKHNLLRKEEDSDPISVVSNLFDVAMVFAVALMVALVSRYNMTEVFSQEDFTMVKNPGRKIWKSSLKKEKKSIGILLRRTRIKKKGNVARKSVSPMNWITGK